MTIRGIVCSTVIVWRPMPMVPSLEMLDCGTVNARVAAPMPDSGAVTDSPGNPAGSIVQEHPAGAGIVRIPEPPEGPKTDGVAVASNEQGSETTAAEAQLMPEATVVTDVPSVAARFKPSSTRNTGVPDESLASLARPLTRVAAEPMTVPSAALSNCRGPESKKGSLR